MNKGKIIATLGRMFDARVDSTTEGYERMCTFNVCGHGFVVVAVVYNTGDCHLVNPFNGEIVKSICLDCAEGGEE